jgi:ribonuclease P/MRP protein subunit POP5
MKAREKKGRIIFLMQRVNMKGRKSLLPTLTEKKRYVAFEVLSDTKLPDAEVKKEIATAFLSLVGTTGAARAALMFVPEQYNSVKQRGIVRIGHKNVDALKSAFCLTKKISGRDAVVRSIGVSGMLNKAKSFVTG